MLEVAAATLSCKSAGRCHAAGSGFEDLDGVRPQERLGRLGDLDAYALAGQGMPDKDDLAIHPSHTVTAVRDRTHDHNCVIHV